MALKYKVRRPFKVEGLDLTAGDVVDFAPMSLPIGRVHQLVSMKYIEAVEASEPRKTKVVRGSDVSSKNRLVPEEEFDSGSR